MVEPQSIPVMTTAADVRGLIEAVKAENGVGLLEAIILYAEKTGVEVEALAPIIQGSMRAELEAEARSLKLLKPLDDASDTRGSKKSPPSC